MLHIEPYGGLANRMRSVAAGMILAQKAQAELCVHWCKNNELGATFNELFEPIYWDAQTYTYIHTYRRARCR